MSTSDSWSDQPLVEPLTDRELEILAHFAERRSNREIADALVLSLNTVKWYARQIYGKLGVKNRREAVARAKELGLLETTVAAAVPGPNLPAQLTPFLGRHEETTKLCQLMSESTSRLLTVTGPGGMGKTRMAIQAADCLLEGDQETFRDGVFFVPLASVDDSTMIVPALAQAVGFGFYGGQERPEQQLKQYLRSKRMLLVLDNLEHLIDQESIRLLTELLTAAPGIRMLVTSRTRLNVQGEYLFPLGGMDVPEREAIAGWKHPVERAETYSGIQLFLHSARRLRPDFALDASNLTPIADICLSVEGMPLGIELAAGWVAVLEPAEIASEMERSLDILATDAGNVPERQQSLRSVFDTSWKLLTEEEQQAVQTLSVFQDGFDRQAVEQAGEVSLGTLLALVNKSWIQQGAGGSFQLHDLLRRYGEERLARDPVLEAATRDRHSDYYCHWLSQQEQGMWGAQQGTTLAAIEGDIGNVHQACIWAAVQGRLRQLGQAVNALGLFHYQWRGSYQPGARIFRRLAEALRATEDWPDSAGASTQRTMVRVLGWQSSFCGLVGDVQQESRAIDDGLALLEGPTLADEDTRFERAHIAWQSGYRTLYTEPATAHQHLAESVELFREVGYKWGLASALLGLGRAARGVGAFEEAREAMESSLALHREMGNRHGESETLATMGGLAIKMARLEEAEALIRESLAITPKTDRFGTAFGLGFLGMVRLHTGQLKEAEAPLKECIALHKDLGMRSFRLHWRTVLGEVYLHGGRYGAARAQAELILSRARTLKYDHGVSFGSVLLGKVALAEGALGQAEQYLQGSMEVAAEVDGGRRGLCPSAWLGLAARMLGHRDEAWEQLTCALETAHESRLTIELMAALGGVALLLADEGEAERAVELYALASRYPLVAKSRWFEDVIGQKIAAVAATLPPEVVDAARERGEARELEGTVAELVAQTGPVGG